MGTPRTSERLRLGESSAARSTEGGYMTEKTYLCTKHEWEEALAVHRPAVLRTQGLEDGTPCRGKLERWMRKNGGSGGP